MTDTPDDKVAQLKGGQKQPTLREKAQNAVNKARTESFEAKMKEEVKLLAEEEKAVRLRLKKIEQLEQDYESGF